MDNNFKKILFVVVTFSLGAVSGYFVSKRITRDQYRADVADIQVFYRQKLDELGVVEYDEIISSCANDFDEQDVSDKEREDVIATYRGDKRRCVTDYTKPSLFELSRTMHSGTSAVLNTNGEEKLGEIDPNAPDEEYVPSDDPEYEAELEQMAEEAARRRSENMKNGDPYLIDVDEYREGPSEYDRQALYYYTHDRVLCEDDDSKVEDEEECVGFDYEDKLDMQTTCWVRNDKLCVLYEIHRIDDSYKKSVLGVSETPREREFRIQGRRKQAMDDR